MAGETVRTEAICLDVRPWSRTSHVVTWLTPSGRLGTVVRGAVRPKSHFLGQYDLNYTCDILYYARAKGELHALRDCAPVTLREGLRRDYRALALAGYFRRLAAELSPSGTEARAWFDLLAESLDGLGARLAADDGVSALVAFELSALRLAGLSPDFSGYDRRADWSAFCIATGTFSAAGGRCVRVSRAVAAYLARGAREAENLQIPLDAARVIGVFYQFHMDCAVDVRRTVLGMICQKQGR